MTEDEEIFLQILSGNHEGLMMPLRDVVRPKRLPAPTSWAPKCHGSPPTMPGDADSEYSCTRICACRNDGALTHSHERAHLKLTVMSWRKNNLEIHATNHSQNIYEIILLYDPTLSCTMVYPYYGMEQYDMGWSNRRTPSLWIMDLEQSWIHTPEWNEPQIFVLFGMSFIVNSSVFKINLDLPSSYLIKNNPSVRTAIFMQQISCMEQIWLSTAKPRNGSGPNLTWSPFFQRRLQQGQIWPQRSFEAVYLDQSAKSRVINLRSTKSDGHFQADGGIKKTVHKSKVAELSWKCTSGWGQIWLWRSFEVASWGQRFFKNTKSLTSVSDFIWQK